MIQESAFWQAYRRFLNASLVTETPHPQTVALSDWARQDLLKAFKCLAQLDLHVLNQVNLQGTRISALQQACKRCMDQGGRVVLVGCGASGRIAAQIEHDWRLTAADPDRLISLLAGGDVALIESVEASEDHPDYAIAQLKSIHLEDRDLVIALSAGGESPFILGALHYAKIHTESPPWFLYCNPDAALLKRNSQHPVGQRGFALFNLEVGPMALTGSTRMQATTAMTFVLMQALFPKSFNAARWQQFYTKFDWSKLLALTEWESACYQQHCAVIYQAPAALALPVLADMTERAPTFNLPPFPNQQDAHPPLWNYMLLTDVPHGEEAAWKAILLRAPRSLNRRIHGFDLSQHSLVFLESLERPLAFLTISHQVSGIHFHFGEDPVLHLPLPGLNLLERQFFLRLLLVNHSTLMMGRLGYYQGNLMTHLKPSNFKLIDRAIRYVLFLAEHRHKQQLSYEKVAHVLFTVLPQLQPEESIVLKSLKIVLQLP